MSLQLDYPRLLAKFDELAADEIIFHSPAKVVQLADSGFRFEFRITETLINRESFEGHLKLLGQPEHVAKPKPVFFGPGSDITNGHPDLLITTVNGTHLLVYNKFPIYRPHLLAITVDSYRRQHEPLEIDNFEAAWAILHALDSPHYAMFNCTPDAGASCHHKHMHFLPRPELFQTEHGEFGFFPDKDSPSAQNTPPYRYFVEYFNNLGTDNTVDGTVLLRVYTRLLNETRAALGIETGQRCPHNVVLVKEWMIVIPRRTNDFKGVTANSAGMMGSVWLRTEAQLENWKAQGLAHSLMQLGLPALAEPEKFVNDTVQ